MQRKRWQLILIAALLLAPRPPHAQAGGAEAEQLFRDAKRLMRDGKFAEACLAFDESYKADPVVTTLINRADCREKNGQIASAWSLFLDVDCETRGNEKQSALNKTAKDRASKLEQRLSYMTVSVPDESRVDGLELTRNAEAFGEGMWNRAIPMDGGEYVIAGRAPGHEQWSTTVTVPNENGRVGVDVPKFKEAETLVEPADDARASDDPVTRSPHDDDVLAKQARHSIFTSTRKVALGVAGLSAVSFGAAIVLGLQKNSLEGEARRLCPQNPCPDANAANAIGDRAEQRALFANISLGVGAAAIIGAAVLWFTGGPSETTVFPAVSSTFAGLDIEVRF